MEDEIIGKGQEGLNLLLELAPVVYVLLIILTALIFAPMKKGDKARLDLRLVGLIAAVGWAVVMMLVYSEEYFNPVGGFKLSVGATIGILVIHFRSWIIKRR